MNTLILCDIAPELIKGGAINWGKNFAYLKSKGFVCAEAGDADEDGIIEKEDGDEIMNYYVNHAVNLPVDTLVGLPMTKTIFVEA